MLHMEDYAYLPPVLEVPPGVTVYVMNFGQEPHTVTSSTDRSLFDVQNIPPGGEPLNFTAPTQPGEYPYYCIYHGNPPAEGMAGTLVVKAAAPTRPASPTAPTPVTPEADARDTPLAWGASVATVALVAALARRR